MALSRCIKCSCNKFEMVENTPNNSGFKLNFIQCAACGAVVGVMDYYNIGIRLKEIEDKIGDIKNAIENMSYKIDRIQSMIIS